MSDVKLFDQQVKVEAWDLLLDAADRRPGTDPAAFRRALVHDSGDALTLNYAADYKGGVRIFGGTSGVQVDTSAPVTLRCTALKLGDPGGSTGLTALDVADDTLSINSGVEFDAVVLRGRHVAIDSPRTAIGVDLPNNEYGGIIVYSDRTEVSGGLKVSGDVIAAKHVTASIASLEKVVAGDLSVGDDVTILGGAPSRGHVVAPPASAPLRHQTITIGPMPAQTGLSGSTILATTTTRVMVGSTVVPEVLDLVAEIRSLRQRVAALEHKLGGVP